MKSIQEDLILDDPDKGIVLPNVQYHTYAQITQDVAYKGKVIPLPETLVQYLRNNELKVFLLILREIRNHGMCYLSQYEMGEMLGVTSVAISHAMHNLVEMGLVLYDMDKGVKRNSKKKVINFSTLTRLADILADSKPDAPYRLRNKIKTRNIMTLTDAQEEWFKTWCKNPDDDIEAEEYN